MPLKLALTICHELNVSHFENHMKRKSLCGLFEHFNSLQLFRRMTRNQSGLDMSADYGRREDAVSWRTVKATAKHSLDLTKYGSKCDITLGECGGERFSQVSSVEGVCTDSPSVVVVEHL